MRWTSATNRSRTAARDRAVLVELGLRDDPAEPAPLSATGRAGVGHAVACSGSTTARKAISSKSSSPAMVWVRAVVVAAGEQAVEVAFVGDLDHRADRRGEQVGVRAHVGAFAASLR